MENELTGLVIKDSERKTIYEIAKKYNLNSNFDLEFILEKKNYLFVFTKNSIGLCGTFIMRKLKNIIHGSAEFDDYLGKIIK